MSIFLFSSCGISKKGMEDSIKQDFQETLDRDAFYKKYGMTVQKVVLTKIDSNLYDGIVTILLNEKSHNIRISVKRDGYECIWKAEPSSFSFLFLHDMNLIR